MYPAEKFDMTYGEFHNRRNALLAKIKRLKEEYRRATDDRYTPLVDKPGQFAMTELIQTEIALGDLIAEWELIAKKRGVTP